MQPSVWMTGRLGGFLAPLRLHIHNAGIASNDAVGQVQSSALEIETKD